MSNIPIPSTTKKGLAIIGPAIQTKVQKVIDDAVKAATAKTAKVVSIETAKAKKAEPTVPGKRGRKPMEETMTKKEIAAEVDELLADLTKATDLDEKKRLRRALRRRGHTGGLGIREAAKAANKSSK